MLIVLRTSNFLLLIFDHILNIVWSEGSSFWAPIAKVPNIANEDEFNFPRYKKERVIPQIIIKTTASIMYLKELVIKPLFAK